MKRLTLLALALALLPACSEPVTYSYFVVHARLDATVDVALLNRIAACGVVATTPAREDTAELDCRQHFVSSDLGTFEYTTSLTSGAIKFKIIANDFNGILLASGETPPLDIQVGKTVTAEVVGTAAPGAKPMDEPAPDAGAPVTPDSGAGD
jgi:hypothetical protein